MYASEPGSLLLRLIASSATTSMKSALPHRVDRRRRGQAGVRGNEKEASLPRYGSRNRAAPTCDHRATDIILDAPLISYREERADDARRYASDS